MLYGKGGEVGIHHQLSRRSSLIEEMPENGPMVILGLQETDRRAREPIIDNRDGFPDGKGFLENLSIRYNPEKCQNRRPGEPNRLRA